MLNLKIGRLNIGDGNGLLRRRSLWYAFGVLASTASTYILFLCFTMRASPEEVGLFALVAAAVTTLVQFLDGVSSQRITQSHPQLVRLNRDEDQAVNFLNVGRLVILIAAASALSIVWLLFDSNLGPYVGILLLGQGAYAYAVSTRIYGDSPVPLVRLQFFNFLIFCISSALVLTLNSELSAASLLLISGISSTLASLPFLFCDINRRRKMTHKFRQEWELLFSTSWRNIAGLVAYQAVNALGGATDSLLTSLSGLRAAAEYQIIRRPMLALSSLNVALGQTAINKYSRGDTRLWKRSLLKLLPVLVAWPLMGFIGLALVRFLTPPAYEISILAGELLALSFAIGAFLQITGTVLLVRMQTTALFLAVVGRIAVLVLSAVLTVPSLGVVGIGLSMVIANVVLLGTHLAVLISGDRKLLRTSVSGDNAV